MEESLGVGRSPVARGRALVRAEKVVHYHADEVFQTWGVETGRIFSRKQIEENLRKIEEGNTYGLVLRAKGILPVDGQQWIQFDYVPGEIELKKIDPDYTGRVCVIGRELNQKAIETLFLG